MQDMTMIWNAILTVAVGSFLWWVRGTNADIDKVRDDLKDHALSDAKTREFMATNYATKLDVNAELTKILNRFDALEKKLDRWMEKH
jgi:hypothetical protein